MQQVVMLNMFNTPPQSFNEVLRIGTLSLLGVPWDVTGSAVLKLLLYKPLLHK